MQQVAMITGASSGIGYATAVAFAHHGTNVVATARRAERLAQLEHEINQLPGTHGDVLTVTVDVRNLAGMENAVQQALQRFGRLDILVANAGTGHRGSIADASGSDLETVLRTNIDGVLHSVRAAVPAMKQTGGGHIILISSVMSNMPAPGAAIYAASKAFVSHLASSLRLELEADNIWVTDMRVGQTITEFAENRLGKPGRVANQVPRMTAEQVAEAIVRVSTQKQKTVILRWLDRLIILSSILLPGLVGRVARRVYK